MSTPTTTPVADTPRVSTAKGHVVLTMPVGDDDVLTACTCGHRCTNPAHTAAWAHDNHARGHRRRR